MNTLDSFSANFMLCASELCEKARAAVSGRQALAVVPAKPASLPIWEASSEEDSGGTLSPMDGGDDCDDRAIALADEAASPQPVRFSLAPAASTAAVQTRNLYRVVCAISQYTSEAGVIHAGSSYLHEYV